MPAWTQVYFPWGERLWPLSTLVAALPVVLPKRFDLNEELDLIINYNIKHRTSQEGRAGEDEE